MHAIAGERASYRPVESALAAGSCPRLLARAFRERLGLEALYLADLDAIEGRAPPARALLEELIGDGFRLLVDAGVRDAASARRLQPLETSGGIAPAGRRRSAGGALETVVGLETLEAIESLEELLAALGPDGLCFSLDLRGGAPMGGPAAWRRLEPLALALAAIDLGVRQVLLLDLAAVGRSCGCPVLSLAEELRQLRPHCAIDAGGGVRGLDDLEALESAGVRRVLVGTALHRGRIGRDEVRRFLSSPHRQHPSSNHEEA